MLISCFNCHFFPRICTVLLVFRRACSYVATTTSRPVYSCLYDVQPWELRHIENEKSHYAKAFSDHRSKGRYPDNKLDEWREALKSAADISGYDLRQYPDNLCETFVSSVLQVVQERKNRIPLDVAKYPVGLAELVEDFGSCLERRRHKRPMDKVTIAGIYGLGGSGKTTLAKELFNRKGSGYHASSFLSDVRESHLRGELHCLQSRLLKDLFPENREIKDLEIKNVHHGIGELKHSLGRARNLQFLIVLDDIDHSDQLDALLPEGTLSSSSLVIITTRDQSMLRDADIRYKMKGLNRDHAKDLFCSHAFRGQDPPVAYEKLVESFVQFCGGLPLSLKVVGAHLYGKKEYYWKLELEKVKKIQPKDIMQRLKISFDALDQEEQQIFIDIACFFNKTSSQTRYYSLKSTAISIWKASGWSAEHALQTLQDKSLVEIDKWYAFEMHDHLRDLGRQMADDLGPPRLWRPQILRSMEAKGFKKILAETKVRCFHRFPYSFLHAEIEYFIGTSNDSADTDLLGLRIGSWHPFKLVKIPSWIPLQKLHYLSVHCVEEMWSSFHQQLQTNTQASFELRNLEICFCPHLQKLPELIGMFCHLEELKILSSLEKTDMTSLLESIKQLSNLRSLHLNDGDEDDASESEAESQNFNLSVGKDLISLEASTSSCTTSLETIYFGGLANISKLLISQEICPELRSLEVHRVWNLKEMDLKHLERLQTLQVCKCPKLGTISGLSSLIGLQSLTVTFCDKLKTISGLSSLTGLQTLTVFCCDKLKTISGLSSLIGLQSLTVTHCDKLKTISELSSLMTGLQVFEVKNCKGLKSLPTLPHQRHLGRFEITGCDELQSVEGFGEWPELKSLIIEVPHNGCAWVRNFIYGLKRLPSKETILVGMPVDRASSRLDVNLFSEVTNVQALELEKLKLSMTLPSSSNAITIYVFLGSLCLRIGPISIRDVRERMITVLLPHHNSDGLFTCVINIKKGFKVIVNKREEGKALTLMQRIVDLLYR